MLIYSGVQTSYEMDHGEEECPKMEKSKFRNNFAKFFSMPEVGIRVAHLTRGPVVPSHSFKGTHHLSPSTIKLPFV